MKVHCLVSVSYRIYYCAVCCCTRSSDDVVVKIVRSNEWIHKKWILWKVWKAGGDCFPLINEGQTPRDAINAVAALCGDKSYSHWGAHSWRCVCHCAVVAPVEKKLRHKTQNSDENASDNCAQDLQSAPKSTKCEGFILNAVGFSSLLKADN